MNAETKSASSTCIVVLGMHRSGTSAMAGVLHLLGAQAGRSLLPAQENVNPKGFWEHAEIVSVHEQLLEAFDSSWNDPFPIPDNWWQTPLAIDFRNRIIGILRRDFDKLPIWLIKDPRMCRLMPFWLEVFRELPCEPQFILALRHPAEVTHSLRKRDGLTEAASCLLWLVHMLEAEYHTRRYPRVVVSYESLLSDWRKVAADLSETLSFQRLCNAATDTETAIDAFLDPSLRQLGAATLPDHPACRLAQDGFELLSERQLDKLKLDKLRALSDDLVSLVAPWSRPLSSSQKQNLHAAIARLESEKAAADEEVNRIKRTISWQITKPLRALGYPFRSLYRKRRLMGTSSGW